MTRPSRALVDLDALRHNYGLARQRHGGRALAVLKANAYGHGAVACARALQSCADGFAVAFLDEALALRAAGIARPILLLEGCFGAEELDTARRLGLWIVVHHEEQLRMLECAGAGAARVNVWLKFDSGMRRAGFALSCAREVHARLAACAGVAEVVLMSHFARADEASEQVTQRQMADFDAATAGLPGPRSLCNSAGLLAWPAARRDWARPGIMLYGAQPLRGADPELVPVMALQSQVFAVRALQRGDALGYGARFVAEGPCRVGLVALGYADGYPRRAPDGTPVAIGGALSRIIGRVSMDMLTVDLTPVPQAGVGSTVELWGRQVGVNTVAEAAGTIAYELLCHVQRVPREYVGAGAAEVATAGAPG
ncbi:MAG: alanine racemase [Comamonas sp.]